MFQMFSNTFRTAIAAAPLLILLASTFRPVLAEQPEPQVRTFMVINADDFPDIEDDASQFLVTHAGQLPSNAGDSLETADSSPLFPGGKWIIGGYVTHVTADGPHTFVVYWLDELPPGGAIAYTGPDSDAFGEVVWVRPANPSADENGDWVIETEPSSPISHHRRFVVTGWFSR